MYECACESSVIDVAGAQERDMFTLVVDAAIEAISVVFEQTRDEAALEKTLQVCAAGPLHVLHRLAFDPNMAATKRDRCARGGLLV